MNCYRSSLIRFALNNKTVLHTEHQLNTRVYINQSYSAAVLWHLPIIRQNVSHILTPHSHSVVRYCQIYVIVVLPAPDQDSWIIVSIHISHTIVYSIFKNRLHDKLHRAEMIDFLRDIILRHKALLIAVLLYIHIVFAMLQLIFNTDNCPSV